MVSMPLFLLLALTPGQQSAQPVLLDFTATWCGPCKQMKPVVEQLKAAGYPIQEVDFDRRKDLVQQYRVSSVPTFVLVANGAEVARQEGAVPAQRLAQLFTALRPPAATTALAATTDATGRPASEPPFIDPPPLTATGNPTPPHPTLGANPPAPPAVSPPSNPGRSPVPTAPQPQRPAQQPSAVAAPPAQSLPLASTVPAPAAAPPASPAIDTRPRSTPFTNGSHGPAASSTPVATTTTPDQAEKLAMAATVRLQVVDDGGVSYATGTIIDTHGAEVLVLTCGHVFKTSQGRGRILVDTYYPGGPKKIEGEMVAWEVQARDVGMISFRPEVMPQPARLARDRNVYAKGDLVFSIGCNHGADPTLQMTRIMSIDRYTGASNIQIAGQPVDGRSGGGLFTADGRLVGVCNAADPADDEGIYAALPAVQKHLAANGMRHLLQARPPSMLAQASHAEPPSPSPSPLTPLTPASTSPSTGGADLPSLTPVVYNRGGGGEVIVVIRSPDGRDQVMSIKQPSPELLRQLQAASQSASASPEYQASNASTIVRGQNGAMR